MPFDDMFIRTLAAHSLAESPTMNDNAYLVLAPIKLLPGVDEKTLLTASDAFEKDFVQRQSGVIKRILLRDTTGNYADLVFFESGEAAQRLMEAEATSPQCMAYFEIMQMPDESAPDMGVLAFESLKTYAQA